MFGHIFKYRFKTLIREKEEIFWNALFPIVLATFFYLAFSSISNRAYVFHSIPVAVVYEQENAAFTATLNSLSEDASQGEEFLIINNTDIETAKDMLKKEDVVAIITVNESINVTVTKSGINQTAIQSFVSQYLQKEALIKDVMTTNPAAIDDLIAAMQNEADCIKNASLSGNDIDPMITYFFSLIAMALLFGGFFGLKTGRQLKADTSPEGLRKSLSPGRKGTFITAEFLATYIIHIISVFILLLYLMFVLKIDLGNRFGYIALICAIGSLMGISLGLFIGSIPRIKETTQDVIYVTLSLTLSFFSGLMFADIKIMIQHSVPVLNYINPATLIADAFYSLLVYDTHERYFFNIGILAIYAIVLCFVSFLMTRRKSYASL